MKSLRALAAFAVLAVAHAIPLRAQPGRVAPDQVAAGRPAFGSVPKTILALPDGGALVGGSFTNVNTSFKDYLVRVRADGSLDTSFNRLLDGPVATLVRQPDGKILVGGSFTSAGGVSAVRLLRLNADAGLTLDTAFSSAVGTSIPAGAVTEIAVDSAGRIYAGIDAGVTATSLYRFAADGTRDATYEPAVDHTVTALAVQSDGKLLVGGDIVALAGLPAVNFGRLDEDGTRDGTFVGASGVPHALLVLQDGRLLLAGSDTSASLVQISATGGILANLNSGHAVHDVVQGPGGQILVLGAGDSGPGRIYQLKGTNPFPASPSQDVDTAFDVGAGPDGSVRAASHVGDGSGSIWLAGDFATYDGFASGYIVKIEGAPGIRQTITFDEIADRTFDPAANTVTLVATTDATGPGLGPITFAVVGGPATLDGDVLTITGPGDITVSASQAGDGTYLAASATRTFTVAPLTGQTITFAQTFANRLATAKPVALVATASSGLAVEFSVSGPAGLGSDGHTLTLTGEAGVVTVTASQPGGEAEGVIYAAATPVVKSFEVYLTAPTRSQKITFAQPAAVTYGTAPVTLAATASSGLPVALEVVSTSPAGIASLEGSELTITGAGKVVIKATQPGDGTFKPAASVTRTLTVKKASLTVKALDQSRLIGQANQPFVLDFTDEDFVNGDTEDDLASTRPVAKTKATTKSAQGDYAITISGGADANYVFVPANPPGEVHVLGFGGAYEALLVDGELTPLGKLTLAVSRSSFTYTGSLVLASQPKAVSFKSTSANPLTPEQDGSSAAGDMRVTFTAADPDIVYDLSFTVGADGALAGSLTLGGTAVATLAHGARVHVFTKKDPAPGSGANTLALHPPSVIFEEDEGPIPGGSGHATASIGSSGVLTLKGKVADGMPLTASLKPTVVGEADSAYLLWTNPYGTRLDSFLAGRLALQSHPEQTRFPNRYYVPAESAVLTWKKAALSESTPASKRDKSYRAGFGPLGLPASLDPWLPPTKKATAGVPAGTLVERLGLADDTPPGVLALFHDAEELDLGAREALLPSAATLASNGVLTVPDAAATSWKIKLSSTTGAFSGSFVLRDQVNPPPAKPVDRTVTFSGTLRQAPANDTTLGTGFFLVPGFAKTDEQPSGEIRFTAPVPVSVP